MLGLWLAYLGVAWPVLSQCRALLIFWVSHVGVMFDSFGRCVLEPHQAVLGLCEATWSHVALIYVGRTGGALCRIEVFWRQPRIDKLSGLLNWTGTNSVANDFRWSLFPENSQIRQPCFWGVRGWHCLNYKSRKAVRMLQKDCKPVQACPGINCTNLSTA